MIYDLSWALKHSLASLSSTLSLPPLLAPPTGLLEGTDRVSLVSGSPGRDAWNAGGVTEGSPDSEQVSLRRLPLPHFHPYFPCHRRSAPKSHFFAPEVSKPISSSASICLTSTSTARAWTSSPPPVPAPSVSILRDKRQRRENQTLSPPRPERLTGSACSLGSHGKGLLAWTRPPRYSLVPPLPPHSQPEETFHDAILFPHPPKTWCTFSQRQTASLSPTVSPVPSPPLLPCRYVHSLPRYNPQ